MHEDYPTSDPDYGSTLLVFNYAESYSANVQRVATAFKRTNTAKFT